MKALTFAISIIFSFTAIADHHQGKDIDARKTKIMQKQDQRISEFNQQNQARIAIVEEFKTCVKNAADGKAIKACRASKKEKMKAHRESNKQKRAERKSKRKKS